MHITLDSVNVMSAGRVGAAMETGRGEGRPLLFSQPMAALAGMATAPSRWSTGVWARDKPTITSVPPGARWRRKRVSAKVNGRWWIVATHMMTS